MRLKQSLSLTGFRIFFLLDFLLKAPASKSEILAELSDNPDIQNVTFETIKLDINTLKKAGFEIATATKGGERKYKIIKNPIKISVSKEELQILQNIKFALIELSTWEEILRLHNLFAKISTFIQDEDIVNRLMDFGYFSSLNFELLKELNVLANKKKTVALLYNSPNSGIKEIDIKLDEIKYTNSKLYIIGTSLKYPDRTVLRADNIIKIIKLLKPDEDEKPKENVLIYKVSNEKEINLLQEETILSKTDEYTEIQMMYDNEFFAVQRVLSFGLNIIEINNKKIKAKYKQTLRNILKIYEGQK